MTREGPEDRARRLRPAGFVPGGPSPRGALPGEDDLHPSPEETLAYLAGDFRIFQRRHGNRWSLDELVTAAVAAAAHPAPARLLDLGTGTASVLLLLAWKFPHARGLGVERQAVSVALARRSLRYNGVDDRLAVAHDDLRDHPLAAADVITGTPPYFPAATGAVSARVQRGGAAFELAGAIDDYARAARRALEISPPEARFVVCNGVLANHGGDARSERALTAAGLSILARRDVIPKEGKAPLFAVWTASLHGGVRAPDDALTVRDRDDRPTEAFQAIRAAFGMPPLPAPRP